jgi:hypothetical protein
MALDLIKMWKSCVDFVVVIVVEYVYQGSVRAFAGSADCTAFFATAQSLR